MIRRTALRHGVDPTLALAIGWQESGWNQQAVSVANAIGAMQVIPSSGDWASQLAGRRLDLLDAQDNVTAGVVILRAPVQRRLRRGGGRRLLPGPAVGPDQGDVRGHQEICRRGTGTHEVVVTSLAPDRAHLPRFTVRCP